MIPRLDELEKDLALRRMKAEAEGWLGEIDGINQTLAFRQAKRSEAERLLQRPTVELGLPTIRRSDR
ncbi:recombinase [Embleya sp. NPDC050493]|uniref:recombinase n=1 Tax=Embleya sp. NPDC050493 TaxID=3363989 RepID=UPI0037B9F740